jgi:membrane-associated phospholipid phosphatase
MEPLIRININNRYFILYEFRFSFACAKSKRNNFVIVTALNVIHFIKRPFYSLNQTALKIFYKGISNFLSILFHPLFIVIYVLYLFILINPYLFPYRQGREFGAILLVVLFTAVIIPGIAILLLYGVGLIKSLRLEERTERIGPLMITSVAYLWLFLNIRTHNAIPGLFSAFILGALISLALAFFINNFQKVSLHAVGIGGLLIAIFHILITDGKVYTMISLGDNYTMTVHSIVFMISLLIIAGAVLSSRLYLRAHQLQDVFGGLLVGVMGQLFALIIY